MLSNTFVNNIWIKTGFLREIRKYLDLNQNENTSKFVGYC